MEAPWLSEGVKDSQKKTIAFALVVLGPVLMAGEWGFAGRLGHALFLAGLALFTIGLVKRIQLRSGEGASGTSNKNEAQVGKKRNKFTLRSAFAQFIGTFGYIFVLASFYGIWDRDAPLGAMVGSFLLGVALIASSVMIIKPPQVFHRPPDWWCVATGMICSTCTLACFGLFYYFYQTPKENTPRWMIGVFAVLVMAWVFSACTCIGTGIQVIKKSRTGQRLT